MTAEERTDQGLPEVQLTDGPKCGKLVAKEGERDLLCDLPAGHPETTPCSAPLDQGSSGAAPPRSHGSLGRRRPPTMLTTRCSRFQIPLRAAEPHYARCGTPSRLDMLETPAWGQIYDLLLVVHNVLGELLC